MTQKFGTMKIEDVKVGTYVRWAGDRYMKSWDIYGKITAVAIDENDYTRVTILGFDDMKENTVGSKTVNEECYIVDRDEAMLYFDKKILGMRKNLLEKEFELNNYRVSIEKLELVKEDI